MSIFLKFELHDIIPNLKELDIEQIRIILITAKRYETEIYKEFDFKKQEKIKFFDVPVPIDHSKENKLYFKLYEESKYISDSEIIFQIEDNTTHLFKMLKFKNSKRFIKMSLKILIIRDNSKSYEKKLTIKDLCPEEKAKIGDLLKKLADEKEEKEKILKSIEEEKKLYESRIDSLIKEKESTLSNLNTSLLKSESFMETYIPNPKFQTINNSDISNLKDKFEKMFQSVKKAAKQHEEYFSKQNITLNDTNLIKEDKPISLELKPMEAINKDKTDTFDNLLQTSIININDDIKENNLFTDRSFESDIFETNNNIYNKLKNVKDKLIKENSNIINVNSINKPIKDNNKYKTMLNRVRVKSKEQASRPIVDYSYDSDDDKIKKTELRVSTGGFEIKASCNEICRNIISPINKLSKNKFKFKEEEYDLISILNSNIYSRSDKNKREESFYDENLCDLIDDIESREELSKNKNNIKNFGKSINIDMETEKKYLEIKVG